MKTLIPYVALTILSLQILPACGAQKDDASDDKQIATNLDGQGASEATYLYWIQDAKVFQGQCTAAPQIVANCQEGVRSLGLDAFKAAVARGLSASITELTTHIGDLDAKLPQLAFNVADLTVQITNAESDMAAKAELKKSADEELAKSEANVQALTAQIAGLDAEILANPANQDIKTLRTKRQNELNDENGRKNAATTKVSQAAQALASATAARDAKKVEAANSAFEFAAKKSDLAAAKISLTEAQAQSAALEETMTRLASDAVVYDVKSGETVFQGLRPFVSRFKEVFDGGGVFATQLTYADLDLAIPTTGTAGTVDFPMDVAIFSTVQDVAIQYSMTHGSPSDLTLSLVAPDGNGVTLRNQQSGNLVEICSADLRTAEGFVARSVSFSFLNNRQAKGTWKLRVVDNNSFSSTGTGKLQSVKLMLKLKAN